MRRTPIACSKVCQPRTSGGLKILDLYVWNQAAISKLLWALFMKKNKLWILWVHVLYIKKQKLEDMDEPKRASWLVRKIIGIKAKIQDSNQVVAGLKDYKKAGRFNIKLAYKHLMPEYPKVEWKSLILLRGLIPKKQFIFWMALHKRLAMVDRLQSWGIMVPMDCVLCQKQEIETFDHIFFECSYTRELWQKLLKWINISRSVGSWEQEIQGMSKRVKNERAGGAMIGFLFAAVIYHVWIERNNRRFGQSSRDMQILTHNIVLKMHIKGQKIRKWSELLTSLNSFP